WDARLPAGSSLGRLRAKLWPCNDIADKRITSALLSLHSKADMASSNCSITQPSSLTACSCSTLSTWPSDSADTLPSLFATPVLALSLVAKPPSNIKPPLIDPAQGISPAPSARNNFYERATAVDTNDYNTTTNLALSAASYPSTTASVAIKPSSVAMP